MHGAGTGVAALRPTEDASAPARDAVESPDDREEREPLRRYRQLESSALAARRPEHAAPHQLVQDLAQVGLRDLRGGGEIHGLDRAVLPVASEMHDGT